MRRKLKDFKESIIGGWESNKEILFVVEERGFELFIDKKIKENVIYGN